MRAREFLLEKGITPDELIKYSGRYLDNIIAKINKKQPFQVVSDKQQIFGKTVLIDPEEEDFLKKLFSSDGTPETRKVSSSGNIIPPQPIPKIIYLKVITDTGEIKRIATGNLEKTADIKGKAVDYNKGDLGEMALTLAMAARVNAMGNAITLNDFLQMAENLEFTASSKGSSGVAKGQSYLEWPAGKKDMLEVRAVLPQRSMNFFYRYVTDLEFRNQNSGLIPLLQNAVKFANDSQKITDALDILQKNNQSNTITLICDGVSKQKETKADVAINIDGNKFTELSVKVDRSQLGQASGHDFEKQKIFFSTLFGVDISNYYAAWGTSHIDHNKVLTDIWRDAILPKMNQQTQGNDTRLEMDLVKNIASGIIKYSNTQEPGDVEIVKLLSVPGSPGYKLLKVDTNLYHALEKVDLFSQIGSKGDKKGISIWGRYHNKNILLVRMRSYYSEKANTVRTIIEGGDLLDILAQVEAKKDSAPAQVATTTPTVQNTSTAVTSPTN